MVRHTIIERTHSYRKNPQQNVIALLDNSGSAVASYKYDAWGNCSIDAGTTNDELADLNPFRYRSYYYDPKVTALHL